MARVLSNRLAGEDRATLLPAQVLLVGPGLVLLMWRGARWLARDQAARSFRSLLWAWPAGLVAAFAAGGRPYCVVPLTTVVMLAGIVAAERSGRTGGLAWQIGVNALVSLLVGLPVLPLAAAKVTAEVNETTAETIGWPELARQVEGVVADLPARERDGVIRLAGSYGEAGALDRFGPALGLPPAYSPHNSYADFRQPADDGATVVAVRYPEAYLDRFFDRCDEVARVDNGHDVDNEVQNEPILVCRGLHTSWSAAWAELRFLS